MGLFYESSDQLTEDQLYDSINKLWKPGKTFHYPITIDSGQSRKFNPNWFDLCPCLAYSKYLDGIFCISCVFFGKKSGHVDNKLTKLFEEPLKYWTNASGRMKEHDANSKVHKNTASLMELFKQQMKRDIVPIDKLANTVWKQRIESNGMELKSILKTIILCGQQDFALRGHRDDCRNLDTSLNPGNFQVLLNFRLDSGDSLLKVHFETCLKNAMYRSKTVQNELIDHILDSIVAEIKDIEFFLNSSQRSCRCEQ